MKWSIIGAGGISDRRTIPALLKDKENELVAVMDRVPIVAENIGKKYNVSYFTDEKAMLESVECDAVYIGTPVSCHFEQAITALSFGKHVFVEKPIALTAKESRELVEAFKKAGNRHQNSYGKAPVRCGNRLRHVYCRLFRCS